LMRNISILFLWYLWHSVAAGVVKAYRWK
jgi:hypothetical protein